MIQHLQLEYGGGLILLAVTIFIPIRQQLVRKSFWILKKLVYIDIKMFMARAMHPEPLVVSAFGFDGKRSRLWHLFSNQSIECNHDLTPDFWRMKTTGLTHDHYRGSAASRITLEQLMVELKKICSGKLIIHHGKNDMIAIKIDGEKARQLEREWKCAFPDNDLWKCIWMSDFYCWASQAIPEQIAESTAYTIWGC